MSLGTVTFSRPGCRPAAGRGGWRVTVDITTTSFDSAVTVDPAAGGATPAGDGVTPAGGGATPPAERHRMLQARRRRPW
jgi:hypothetical protein